jgi:hypothetical protein
MALTSLSDVRRTKLDPVGDLVLVSCIVASVPTAGDYVPASSLGLDNIFCVISASRGTAAVGAAAVAATGTVTFADDPVDTATVVIGGITYTFETGALDAAFKVLSGADLTAAAENLAAAVNAQSLADTLFDAATFPNPVVSAVAAAGVVTLTARVPGTGGNAITLTTAGDADITVSGAVLSGGVAEVGTGQIQALPNTQTASVTQDDAGDVWLSHGNAAAQDVRLVVLGTTPGN